MSAIDQTTTEPAAETQEDPANVIGPDPKLTFELRLREAEALRTWLLKPAGDGTTSLDDPLVSHVLAELGRLVDGARATVNVRHELEQAGLSIDHLNDDEVRELGRRVTEASLPGVRT
jgi:hypothetical protein